MDTGSMFGFMDIIVLGCGIYGIYSWYMLVKKHVIKKAFLLGGNLQPEQCKDVEGFAKSVGTKLLIASFAMIAMSGVSLFNDRVKSIETVYWIAMVAFLALLIWYCFALRKANIEFFTTSGSKGIKNKALNKK
jgi:hypothetical protein